MVVIARFRDHKRGRRMRAWLQRSHIRALLRDRDDGLVELTVHPADEHRALDLLLTLFWGLDVDHIKPERSWQRAMTLENALLGVAIALVVAMGSLVAWWVLPVLAVVPIGTNPCVPLAICHSIRPSSASQSTAPSGCIGVTKATILPFSMT